MAKKQPSIADLLNQINPKKIEEYRRHLEELALAESTIKRRLSTLRKFTNWAEKEGYLQKEPIKKAKTERPSFSFLPNRFRPTLPTLPYLTKAYETYSSISITKYLHYAILIIFCVGLGMSLYNQLTGPKAELAEAYPSTLKTPKRYLSFQGRLTDSSNNPISSITNFVFKLYDEVGTGTPPIGGIQLWTSGDCSVDPDEDGIFSVLLGKDCGLEIDETVFSVNPQVWLQITVGTDPDDETLSPRIQIATVGYALSAETLQGFPPGTDVSNIPYIDSAGDITIAAANPSIISSSGTFGIQGQALSIVTTASGNITLAPDNTGVLNINLSGSTGNQMRVTDANITSGALISGYAGTGATGFDLINLSVGSTETTKFKVSALGNTYIAGNLGIGITNPGAYKLNVNGNTNLGGAVSGVTSLTLSGAISGGNTYSGSGNITSTGGLISILGSGNNLISGNLGIGATNPSYKLNVVGAG
ncbi:MAG: phage integrase SAM-like domain-containing protein, partial [Candidatus Marinimicrobia bacterium]|nr:phage integrase SAM-like domain-containing protein [Candidatus Neomarinimicrobiota bacterium]